MSTVFLGLVVAADLPTAAELAQQIRPVLNTEMRCLSDEVVALALAGRPDGTMVEKMEHAAIDLSHRRPVLLVIYDTRVGGRVSALYRNGELIAEFGAEDELWVPITEDGQPLLNATPLKESQLSTDREYETIENAIQLGLKAMGIPEAWPALVSFMES